MSGKEITWNEQLGAWDMCATCLDVAFDAANSGGFKLDDDDYETVESEFDEEPLDNQLDMFPYNDNEPEAYRW